MKMVKYWKERKQPEYSLIFGKKYTAQASTKLRKYGEKEPKPNSSKDSERKKGTMEEGQENTWT